MDERVCMDRNVQLTYATFVDRGGATAKDARELCRHWSTLPKNVRRAILILVKASEHVE